MGNMKLRMHTKYKKNCLNVKNNEKNFTECIRTNVDIKSFFEKNPTSNDQTSLILPIYITTETFLNTFLS